MFELFALLPLIYFTIKSVSQDWSTYFIWLDLVAVSSTAVASFKLLYKILLETFYKMIGMLLSFQKAMDFIGPI